MRARERERVALLARELCAEECVRTAERLGVVWARELPDAYGYAFTTPYVGILLCERRWCASVQEERADTIAHEIAHVIVWCADYTAPVHGSAWLSCFKRLHSVALEMDW